MEEDIMILESECYYLEELGYLRENNHFIRFNQALGNLIKGYRDSENIMENAVKENLELKKYIRELEEQIDKHVYFETTNPKEIEKNYIPKSKIKEKIEELKQKESIFSANKQGYSFAMVQYQINVLQELMEDK